MITQNMICTATEREMPPPAGSCKVRDLGMIPGVSGVTDEGGAEYHPDTSDQEISADLPGFKRVDLLKLNITSFKRVDSLKTKYFLSSNKHMLRICRGRIALHL